MVETTWPVIRNLDDIKALETVPWKQRVKALTVLDAICANAEQAPERAAIKFLPTGGIDEEPIVLSYAQLVEGIFRTANLLNALGVKRGDVVSLLVPPLPQSHLAIWGGSTAGIVSPINFLMEADAIARIIVDSGSTVLIAYDDKDGFRIWEKIEAIRAKLPQLKTVLRIRPFGAPNDSKGSTLDFDTAIAAQRGDKLDFAPNIRGEDTAFLIHTGGTTGVPKLTRITHDNILFKTWATPAMQGLREDEAIFGAAPLYHIGGIEPSSAVPLSLGMCLLIPGPQGFRNKALIENYWKYFARFGLTRLYGVPTSYMATANVPIGDANLSTLRPRVGVGSAPLPAELARRYETLAGVKLSNIYGLTESTAAIAIAPPDGEIKHGSCGLRYPYVDLRVVKKVAGQFRSCATGESGEIVVKGPNVSPGYLLEEHNKGLFTQDGYLMTGDVGRFDEDGYLWITGRSKDIIVRGGHNIDPRITEEALYKHEAVEVAGAVGMPDAYAGELPVAFVSLKAGAHASADDLKAFARTHVQERAAAPSEVFIVNPVPLSAIGKVDKVALRKEAARRHFQPRLTELLGTTCPFEIDAVDRPAKGLTLVIRVSDVSKAGGQDELDRKLTKLFADYAIGWELG